MSDWKNVQYKDGKFQTSTGGGGGGSSTFAGLDDVSFSNLQNGQVPKYNSTTQKWENANGSGGGGTVTDVTIGGVSVVNQQGVAEIPTIPDGLHHYSTTEHVIGTWIDGKPLYERTISVTFTSSTDFSGDIKEGTVDISSFVPNAEQIFVDNGKCYYSVSNSSHRGFYAIICESENKNLNVFTRYVRTNVTGYFVIQYTKTSD